MQIKEVSQCLADPERIKVIGKVDIPDLETIMSYLARIIPGATYSENDGWLVFKKGLSIITIYKDSFVAMTYMADREEALKTLKYIEEMARVASANKDKIDLSKPLINQNLTALDIYKLLPQTNCQECGEATCLAFAVKILNSEREISQCRPLFNEEQYQEAKEKLLSLFTLPDNVNSGPQSQ
ncbi:Fe-S cluster domain protein [Thermodesulfatator indicus DSM 15286]|uniref:Fe-S cluster domain protein n=1 Tax=Thermodesulfatator indicus (strain DSM 15286 / JCM 11887 / CIR29812) TaxID=667014 RepID=F8A9G7_THEID|nr:(Fe-S)-binding protein [Thermodesulfatator indicus]AEH44110.1 Fe-S cluster domain protein [Thermodesulfatator indicus DSM 15286]